MREPSPQTPQTQMLGTFNHKRQRTTTGVGFEDLAGAFPCRRLIDCPGDAYDCDLHASELTR